MSSQTFSNKAIKFFLNQSKPQNLPVGVSIMNPYESEKTKSIVKSFYQKYFDDNRQRVFIVGINPGRFGGGLTGIAFTDPINLEEKCGIKNNLDKKPELSSRFVYKFIDAYGGVKKFYKKFFITALYPLALIKDNKNYNYYDSKELYQSLKPEILRTFEEQIKIGARKDIIISLGKKNEKYLKEINKELGYFEKIVTLDHPRYIMQYKFKKVDEYVKKYLEVLEGL